MKLSIEYFKTLVGNHIPLQISTLNNQNTRLHISNKDLNEPTGFQNIFQYPQKPDFPA